VTDVHEDRPWLDTRQAPLSAREIAEPNLILRCEVGSGAHGIAIKGTDDRDEMGLCIPPPEYVLGNARVIVGQNLQPFEQWIYRTAEERLQHSPEADQRYSGRTPRSGPGDLDLTVYDLSKWAKLAAGGNPTVLLLLFAEPLEFSRIGRKLQQQAAMFASREAGAKFLGYLQAQRRRLLGLQGQMRVTRTELVRRHGHDSKYSSHMIRLGFQGMEYLKTGRISLPMPPGPRQYCRAIREGKATLNDVVHAVEEMESELCTYTWGIDKVPESRTARHDFSRGVSPLPEHPDHQAINRFLVDAYFEHWGL
jgi:hypothetical protein